MNYQTIASQGRYGDTTLVHMTPEEVSGLNALGAAYGSPMTINPTTGYPEAFNLQNLLPTIIGAGLNVASGGALTPFMSGLITGGGYALATGDPMKGLSAGLGAAGGAGLGSGLTAAGSTAMPVQGASTMTENLARAGEGFKALGSSEGINAFMGTPATSAVPSTGVGGLGGLAKSTALSLAPSVADAGGQMPKEEPVTFQPYSMSVTNLSNMPYASSAEQTQLKYDFQKEKPYRLAEGGQISEGGIETLRDGRFLRGDGDGMSDEIPASIEGETDALLSDGEFVIPADVVSHLGNGSSEAGAKVLYQMMDRIRRERTGREEQAKEVKVDRMLPA